MSAAHTPGPWRALPPEEGKPYLRVRGTRLGARYKICNVHTFLPSMAADVLETQANAHLIAAAPDLLTALRAARRFVVSSSEPVGTELDDIDAAIAKATGWAA